MSEIAWTHAEDGLAATATKNGVTYTVRALDYSTWRWEREGPGIRHEMRGDSKTKDEASDDAERAMNSESDRGIPL